MIRFTITGTPRGQGRPRFTKFGRPYKATDDVAWEQSIVNAWERAGKPKIDAGPYRVELVVRMKRPPSHFTKTGQLTKLARAATTPGKPDLDNTVKGVVDALVKATAIPDDRLMVRLVAEKDWNKEPGIDVTITRHRSAPTGDDRDADQRSQVGQGSVDAYGASDDPMQLPGSDAGVRHRRRA